MTLDSLLEKIHLPLVAAGLLLVAGTWYAGKSGIDRVLGSDARLAAHELAADLESAVPDLAAVMGGAAPGPAARQSLASAGNAGNILGFSLFGPGGDLLIASDDPAGIRNDTRRPIAADVLAGGSGRTAITSRYDGASPVHTATAIVPLVLHGRVAGALEVAMDVTRRHAALQREFFWTFLQIIALTSTAFLLPMAAYVQRSRQHARTAERLSFATRHDDLTDLLNRSSFNRIVKAQMAGGLGNARRFNLHFVDLDRFKDVNDTYGHSTGDELLRTVARRLATLAGSGAHVCRLGGDEFALFEPATDESVEPDRLSRRIVRALSSPFLLEEHDVHIGASVGVARYPEDADNLNGLIKAADIALYEAKHNGRGRAVVYDPTLEDARRIRLAIESRLRVAVADEEFELHYQPLYDTHGSSLRGFEALLRLKDIDGRDIPPTVFIPIAEDMGLIEEIGTWVLNIACRAASLWPDNLGVAVNLSPLQFTDGDIVEKIRSALDDTGLEPHRLEVEITEGILMADTDRVMAQLAEIKALGVSIALDDFGTGYSSLSYLWKFPFDKIKIDRSFISDLASNSPKSREVMDTIVALGRVLDLRVTAEGVETVSQMDALRDLHVDYVQGFYYGRPMPMAELGPIILKGSCDDPDGDDELVGFAAAS